MRRLDSEGSRGSGFQPPLTRPPPRAARPFQQLRRPGGPELSRVLLCHQLHPWEAGTQLQRQESLDRKIRDCDGGPVRLVDRGGVSGAFLREEGAPHLRGRAKRRMILRQRDVDEALRSVSLLFWGESRRRTATQRRPARSTASAAARRCSS